MPSALQVLTIEIPCEELFQPVERKWYKGFKTVGAAMFSQVNHGLWIKGIAGQESGVVFADNSCGQQKIEMAHWLADEVMP